MKRFKVRAKKEAIFFTIIEAENPTAACFKVQEEVNEINWIPEERNSLTDGKDIHLLGQPEEVM